MCLLKNMSTFIFTSCAFLFLFRFLLSLTASNAGVLSVSWSDASGDTSKIQIKIQNQIVLCKTPIDNYLSFFISVR